jgi:hypothetical protein
MINFEEFGYVDDADMPTPWYICKMMDQDMIHLSVQDLSDPEQLYEGIQEERRVPSDFVAFLLTPCFLRARGVSPEGIQSLKSYKEKAMDLIRSIAPEEIRNSSGSFRKSIQGYLNRTLDTLYNFCEFDEAKSLVRDILDLMGVDYPLEAITEEDVSLYNTSYISSTKVLHILGLFDTEDFRYSVGKASYYVKRVPSPSLWDVRDFLLMSSSFIASNLYKSFIVLKESGPSDKRWNRMYDDVLEGFEVVEKLIGRIPVISIKNKNNKKELWELNSHDFFFSELKKKLMALLEEIQPGLRDEFVSFFIPEEFQKIFSSKAVYRPWKKR